MCVRTDLNVFLHPLQKVKSFGSKSSSSELLLDLLSLFGPILSQMLKKWLWFDAEVRHCLTLSTKSWDLKSQFGTWNLSLSLQIHNCNLGFCWQIWMPNLDPYDKLGHIITNQGFPSYLYIPWVWQTFAHWRATGLCSKAFMVNVDLDFVLKIHTPSSWPFFCYKTTHNWSLLQLRLNLVVGNASF